MDGLVTIAFRGLRPSQGLAVLQACYALTAELIARDPFALEAMPLHLVASLELGKKNELFLRAHK